MLLDGFAAINKMAGRFQKGGANDSLAQMKWERPPTITKEEAWSLYETNWMARNAVDGLVEDLVASGWEVEITDNPELAEKINAQMEALNLRGAIGSALCFALVESEGYVSLGIAEGGKPGEETEVETSERGGTTKTLKSLTLDKEVDLARVSGLDYVHAFPGSMVLSKKSVTNMFSKDYGEWESFRVRVKGEGGESEDKTVHSSRLLHFQPFPRMDSDEGLSFFQSWYDVLQMIDVSSWSITQLAYQMVFKVLKVDLREFGERAAKMGIEPEELMRQTAIDLNSLTLFVLDKGDQHSGRSPDTLEFPTMVAGASAISVIQDFMWQIASGATRMPRTRLIGNEAGKLTGAEWDSRVYYSTVRTRQKKWIHPEVDKVVRYLLWANGQDPGADGFAYKLKYKDPFPMDAGDKVRNELVQAQSDQIYNELAAKTSDEIREERFGKPGLSAKLFPLQGSQPIAPQKGEKEGAVPPPEGAQPGTQPKQAAKTPLGG